LVDYKLGRDLHQLRNLEELRDIVVELVLLNVVLDLLELTVEKLLLYHFLHSWVQVHAAQVLLHHSGVHWHLWEHGLHLLDLLHLLLLHLLDCVLLHGWHKVLEEALRRRVGCHELMGALNLWNDLRSLLDLLLVRNLLELRRLHLGLLLLL
jgi:hypothetical protein